MKRKLNLDSIDVTTFIVQSAATALRGTVAAAEAITSATCKGATCQGVTCNTSCGGGGFCTCYPA